MAFQWTDADAYRYRDGDIFLGLSDTGQEVGIRTERHLITVAGAGAGKGSALKIPNLLRWRGSIIDIDPKGESATLTAVHRANMGQTVGVVDPYQTAKNGAEKLRVSINPLSVLDPNSLNIRSDIEAFADGLIRRFDPKHEQWAKASVTMIAGVIDLVVSTKPRELWTLPLIRDAFLQPEAVLKAMASQMVTLETRAGLAKDGGAMILDKFASADGIPARAFLQAVNEMGWIGDPAFKSVFSGLREFDLSTLKAGTGTLYLVLPPQYVNLRGQFLRLFTSMGLVVMMSDLADHDAKTGRCLFLLDEFHTLGKMEIVVKAAGLMRGFGVQLWPFLQDLGQLTALYGDAEMHTFFANADAHIFFGNSDRPTLEHVSRQLGTIQPDEISTDVPQQRAFLKILNKRFWQSEKYAREAHDVKHQNKVVEFQHKMRRVGAPRFEPQEIARLIGRTNDAKVASSMIVFANSGDVLNLKLAPYFMEFRKTGNADHDQKKLDREFWGHFWEEISNIANIPIILSGIFYVNMIYFAFKNLTNYMSHGVFYFNINDALLCSKIGAVLGIIMFIVRAYDEAKDYMGLFVEDGIKGGWMSPHYAKRYPSKRG